MIWDVRKHTVQNTSNYVFFLISTYVSKVSGEKKNKYIYIPEVSLRTVTPITLYKQGNREINQVSGKNLQLGKFFLRLFSCAGIESSSNPRWLDWRGTDGIHKFSWNAVRCMNTMRRLDFNTLGWNTDIKIWNCSLPYMCLMTWVSTFIILKQTNKTKRQSF